MWHKGAPYSTANDVDIAEAAHNLFQKSGPGSWLTGCKFEWDMACLHTEEAEEGERRGERLRLREGGRQRPSFSTGGRLGGKSIHPRVYVDVDSEL